VNLGISLFIKGGWFMDDRRFDALTRSMASARSRRQLLKGIAGLGAVMGGVAVSGAGADAKRREEPPCTSWWCAVLGRCLARGARCTRNDQCCSGRCRLTVPDPKISFCD
jgi:serine-rich repeat adhesion-like glycoprotein